jgi:4-amino-4-deoxy-L-arabinose transferase-like glycosyltransferase
MEPTKVKRVVAFPDAPNVTYERRWARLVAILQRSIASHVALLVIIGCYIVFGFVGSLFIRPWQSPDEPAHFEHAKLIPYGTDDELPEVQQPIIDSLYEQDFWVYRGVPEPETRPPSLSKMTRAIIRQVDKTPVYYYFASAAASWTDDILLELYSMRWLSVLLSSLTIPLAYAIAREILPEKHKQFALVAAAFVAFLPMYTYIGASVNPDNLGAPFAAATAWFGVRAVQGKKRLQSTLALLALTLITFWLRRSTIAIIPWAVLIVLALALQWTWKRVSRLWLTLGVAASLAVFIAVLIWPSSLAADWYINDPSLTTSRSENAAYTGTGSFYLRPHNDQPALISHQISIYQLPSLRQQTVDISVMVRGEGPESRGGVQVFNQSQQIVTAPFTAGTDWQPITLQAQIPQATYSLYIVLFADGSDGVYFDDVEMHNPQQPQQLILISNADAEDAFTWWQARYLSNTFVQYVNRIGTALRNNIYVSPRAGEIYPWIFQQLFASFIGTFGWMAINLDARLLQACQYALGAMAVGLLLAWRKRSGIGSKQRSAVLWLALLVLLTIITLLLEYVPYLSFGSYPQGRYLFPVLAPIAVLLSVGMAQILPRRLEAAGILIVIIAFIGINLWCWFGVLLPIFYG